MLALKAGPRKISSGDQYDRFFQRKLRKEDPIILRNGNVEDSVRLMAEIAAKYQSDTALITPVLEGKTLGETCENIWDFIYNYIQYREDQDGVEQIRRPARTWNDRKAGVDCDCMSVFASSILRNLQIPHLFRITKYEKPEFQHVYVIVPTNGDLAGFTSYLTIDGVIDGFNKEKLFSDNQDFSAMNGMPIQLLNGLGKPDKDLSEDQIVYKILRDTKKLIELNPKCQTKGIIRCDAVHLLNYALKWWDDVHNRATALENIAKLEAEQIPTSHFFRSIWAYLSGTGTLADIQNAQICTQGMAGLGDDPYSYNHPTPQEDPNYGSGSGSWWGNWGSGVSQFITSALNIASNWGKDPNQNSSNTNYGQPQQPPIIIQQPTQAGSISTPTMILIGGGILVGALLLSNMMKNQPAKR